MDNEQEDCDPVSIRAHIIALIQRLRDEDKRVKTRELSIAVTKLQEAAMWIDEHNRIS